LRVLQVVFPEPGHANPNLALAAQLIGAGHETAIFSLQEDLAPRLAAIGLGCRSEHVRNADPRTATSVRTDRGSVFVEMTRDVRLYKRWLRYVLLDLVERQIPELRAMVRDFAPDVLCVDPLGYAGVIVAETEHIAWAAIGTQLAALAPPSWSCDYVDILRDQHERRAQLFARHGVRVDFRLGDAVSPWLNTVPTTEVHFPPSLARNDHAVFVGPCVLTQRGSAETQAFPWSRLRPDRRKIYVAGGTQFAFSDDLLRRIDAAVSDEAQLVMVRSAPGSEPLAVSPDTVVVGHAPQLELLEVVDAMVSHGGVSSIVECMRAGKPAYVIPLGHEQPIQAFLTEAIGAGCRLAESASVAELRDAIMGLLDAGATARRCAEISRSLRDRDGPATITGLLERLVATRQPIRPGATRVEGR
jgi:UDP:flavonoid glycosyltransferase YjiC (YdhE family)